MPVKQTRRALQNAFSLQLDGFNDSTWKTVNGLEGTLEVVDDPTVNKSAAWDLGRYPGQVSYSDITLTRGFGKTELFDWFKKVVVDGQHEDRRNGTIMVYLPDLKTNIATFEFTNAWPLSISSSDVSSDSSELMIETLTLVVETLRRTK